jgi:hypothetical protein
MKSAARLEFWACFDRLPERVQAAAREAFALWQRDPRHPSLHFKKLHAREPIYSVRIGENWRALGLLREDTVYWFWIGSHAEYDREIRRH